MSEHYKLIAHSHTDHGNLTPSPEDRKTLKLLNQKKSKLVSATTGEIKEYGQSLFDD